MKNLTHLFYLPVYLFQGVLYRLSGSLFTPYPRFVCFPITFRCNSKCQMCNLWQTPDSQDEINLEKIQEVFSNRLLKKVEDVVLHGGEPTLRRDIAQIFAIVTASLPRLKNITSSTNGLQPKLAKKRIGEILSLVDTTKVNLIFTVSIDGLKQAHETIRGIPGGFDRALETLDILQTFQSHYPIEVKIITVVQPQNLKDLQAMKTLADQYGVEIIFQPLMIDSFYNNSPLDPRLTFSKEQYEEYRQFIASTFLHQRDPKSLFWQNFLQMMDGKERFIPCAYDRYVLSLYPNGDVLPCAAQSWTLFGNVYENPVDKIWFSKKAKDIRIKVQKNLCPKCTFYCGAEYSLKKEFFTFFAYYLRNMFSAEPPAKRS